MSSVSTHSESSSGTFEDDEWPTDIAGGSNPKKPGKFDGIVWKNIKDVVEDPVLFDASDSDDATIRPQDIKQGSLGDCWFVSGCSVVAEFPELIRRVVRSDKSAPDRGRYVFRIWKHGDWQHITVDGQIPVTKSGKKVKYAKNRENEVWVCMLEKAYAKLFGSYAAIESGSVYMALHDLTGAPAHRVKMENFKNKKELWKTLKKWSDEEYIMGCAWKGDGNDTKRMEYNLIPKHAYGILGAVETNGYQLVQCRNPHSGNEWTGPFCDDDSIWDEYSDMREEAGAENNQEDGIFFMDVNDLYERGRDIDVAFHRDGWAPYGTFIGAFEEGNKNWVTKSVTFEVSSTTNAFFCVEQEDPRFNRSEAEHQIIEVSNPVPSTTKVRFQLKGKGLKCNPVKGRRTLLTATEPVKLKKGVEYEVTISLHISDGQSRKAWLIAYADKPVDLDGDGFISDELSESLSDPSSASSSESATEPEFSTSDDSQTASEDSS